MLRSLLLTALLGCGLFAAAQPDQLMPAPASIRLAKGNFRLKPDFEVALRRKSPDRSSGGIHRFLKRLDDRTGLRLPDEASDLKFPGDGLNVWVRREGVLKLKEDESYQLKVTPRRIMLEAETDLGALHGLETLLQLLSADEEGWYFPACTIDDAPRFPWRGLLIDVCRHWQPVEVIKRNLDGMAAMKMNVLHWHLSEDQGFRIECKAHPLLHELGSNGDYYSQEQVREIIAYADARGIRVVPEFDLPGHATSWFVGYPDLASAPGPYQIETRFGVFDPTFDPTQERTYQFLEQFFAEMSALFPDKYLHIGGDENNGKQWKANERIQAWMRDHKMESSEDLQTYFNGRLSEILSENGKVMMGWDEILQPGIPKNIMIQSWRGKEALVKAATEGYDVVLSSGYYIDLCQPTDQHYLNDPLPPGLIADKKAQGHVLGGEATMWAELVSPETIDSRIWPRTCAIAERFWSPVEVRDLDDMYRRLEMVSLQLEELGLLHWAGREVMMRRACRSRSTNALATLLEVCEPLPGYRRHGSEPRPTTTMPLNRIPDMAVPDAKVAREFRKSMDLYLAQPEEGSRFVLRLWMEAWRNNHEAYLKLSGNAPLLREGIPLSLKLKSLCVVGLELLEMHEDGSPIPEKEGLFAQTIANAAEPVAECELKVVEAVEKLFRAVYVH